MPLFQHQNFLAFDIQRQNSAASLARLSQLYLSRFRDSLTVASSNFSAWASRLQTLFEPASAQPDSTTTLINRIYTAFTTPSLTSYATLGATVLALVFFVVKYLMSYRESFSDGRGGRYSPYLASRTSNLSDYVEYLGGNDMPPPDPHYAGGDYHRHSVARPHTYQPPEDDKAPDVLILKYKGIPYELQFVPYAISDGKLFVQDVRHYAAQRLQTNPRRLKLLYKGRELMDDSLQAKEYGLKQKSEVTCVIIDAAGSGDSRSSSEDDSGSGISTNHNQHRTRRRQRGMSNARHRSEGQIPVPLPTQSEYLHPSSATSAPVPTPTARPGERQSRDTLNIPSSYADTYNNAARERNQSHSRHSSPAPSHQSSQHSSPPPAAADPSSPLGRLQALSSTFHTQWLPLCTKFILSPPTDATLRDKEYKKLSESVLAQVVLKADDVELQGDNEARKFRKGLVVEANGVLKKLDEIRKT